MLDQLRDANIARQKEWCPDVQPDLSFRGNELAGEVGETVEALQLHIAELAKAAGKTSNIVKKLERERHGWRGSRATLQDLGSELADLIICADLTASTAGIDLWAEVVRKFNETSEKNGLHAKLPKPDKKFEPCGAGDCSDVVCDYGCKRLGDHKRLYDDPLIEKVTYRGNVVPKVIDLDNVNVPHRVALVGQRCGMCGQLDDDEFHDSDLCRKIWRKRIVGNEIASV